MLLAGLPRVRPGSSWLALGLGSGLGLGLGLVGLDRGAFVTSEQLRCYSQDAVPCWEQ